MFKLKGQVNAKEGVNIYTAHSAFLRVLMKKHNISTYGKDLTLAGSSGLEEDFGLGLTGQLKTKLLCYEKIRNTCKEIFTKMSGGFIAPWNLIMPY